MEIIRRCARSERLSPGKAAPGLVGRGARYQLGLRIVDGLPVVDAPDGLPVNTAEQVQELLNEE